jgi:hypothetical protein
MSAPLIVPTIGYSSGDKETFLGGQEGMILVIKYL